MNKIFYQNIKNYGYRLMPCILESDEKRSFLPEIFSEYMPYECGGYLDIKKEKNQVIIYADYEDYTIDPDTQLKLTISYKNYVQIVDAWNKNLKNPKSYVVIFLDDFDWVNFEAKNQLSTDELMIVQQDEKRWLDIEISRDS
jgi:hypothetical protein